MINDTTRRGFVQTLAYTTLGVSFLDSLKGAQKSLAGKAKHVIYVYLDGGISHTDFLDPKDDPLIKGNANSIRTSGDFSISSYFPNLAKHGNKFVPIRSMTSKSGAHAMSKYAVKTSYNKSSLIVHPTLGSISYNLLGKQHESIPDYISVSPDTDNPGGGYFSKKFYPLSIINPNEGLRYSRILGTETQFNNRIQVLDSLNKGFMKNVTTGDVTSYSAIYDEALKLLKSEDLNVFDLNKETEDVRNRYGKTQIGSGLLLAKRLIKSGVRYCEVTVGGWDMHNDIETNMTNRGGELDKALASLFDDLTNEGLLKDTLVVVATDFGRTPKYNVNEGKDHHVTAFSVLVGGLSYGGYVLGASDEGGNRTITEPLTPGMLNATIGHLIGIPHDKVWHTPVGSSAPNRPMTIGNGARPIMQLL